MRLAGVAVADGGADLTWVVPPNTAAGQTIQVIATAVDEQGNRSVDTESRQVIAPVSGPRGRRSPSTPSCPFGGALDVGRSRRRRHHHRRLDLQAEPQPDRPRPGSRRGCSAKHRPAVALAPREVDRLASGRGRSALGHLTGRAQPARLRERQVAPVRAGRRQLLRHGRHRHLATLRRWNRG